MIRVALVLWVPILLAFTGSANALGSLGKLELLPPAKTTLLPLVQSANLLEPLSCDSCISKEFSAGDNHRHANNQITIDPALNKSTKKSEWYGWTTLMVDGISLLTTPLGVGLVGLWIGPGIVHAWHGNWGRGLLSAAMRPAFGLLAFYYGMTGDPGLMLLCVVAPVAIDAAMAWEQKVGPSSSPARSPTRVSDIPALERQPGQFNLAYRRQF